MSTSASSQAAANIALVGIVCMDFWEDFVKLKQMWEDDLNKSGAKAHAKGFDIRSWYFWVYILRFQQVRKCASLNLVLCLGWWFVYSEFLCEQRVFLFSFLNNHKRSREIIIKFSDLVDFKSA